MIAFALRNWPWLLGGTAALAACAAGAVLYIGHLRDKVAEAKAAQVAAEQAAEMREAEVQVVERYHTRERVIEVAAAPAIEAVELAEGADAPVAYTVLDAWRDGLNSLRDEAPAADDSNPRAPQ